MSGNAPTFDPLDPTPEERDDMLAGFTAAGDDAPSPAITSAAFDHGWRCRCNDMAGTVDEDQRLLARRAARGMTEDEARLSLLEDDIARIRWRRTA